MQKKFISNLALLLVLNLLVKPLAIFGVDVKIQNELGESIFGNYFALLNLAIILNIFLDFGINNFTTRTVAQQPHLIEKYAGKVIPVKFILFVLYSILGLGIGWLLGWTQMDLFILSILLFNQFLISCIAYGRSHLGGLLEFRNDSIVSVADKILYILFAGYILYFSDLKADFSILWLVGIQTICYLITLLLVVYFLNRKLRIPKLNFDYTFSKVLIKKSLPFAILIFLMFLYTRTDALMLKVLLPDGELQSGIYAQGYRILDALVMFAMLFSNLLFPLFSNLFAKKESINTILKFSTKLLVGGAIAVGLIGFFNANWIVQQLYETNIVAGANSMRWLALSFIGFSAIILFGTVLTAKGELRKLNRIAFVGVIMNIILNLILIPTLKAEGSAISTLSTQGFVAIVQVLEVIRCLKIRINQKILFQFSITLVLLLALNLSIDFLAIPLGFFVASLSSLILLFLTGMIDIKQLKEVFLKDSASN